MALVVNTNVTSNIVQRNLSFANSSVNTSIERLSTGYKINRSADDAAGLAIAQGFKSQSSGTLVAKDNTQHGINLLQTAEGDLDVIQDNLQRIRDLSVQAANGTYSTSEKAMLASEVKARIEEIERLAKVSEFSSIKLLDGSTSSMVLQVGANTGENDQLDISDAIIKATPTALNAQLTETAVDTAFETSDGANGYIAEIDKAIEAVSDARAKIGAYQNRLTSTLDSLDVRYENMASSLSTIQDTDIAAEAANLTKAQILQNVSVSLLAQANQNPSVALNLI